jgi:hypothetical protein
MERPTDNEKCISILALRTLDCSQDEVANILHCSKRIVGEVEQWIEHCDLDEAVHVCDNQALRRLVGREFPSLEELSPELLIKADRLTGEDILRHYRADFIHPLPKQDTLMIEAEKKHLSALRNLLAEWMKQLPPPSKLPYVTQLWLTDEMPKERLYEILEHPNTTKLFEDFIDLKERAHPLTKDYHFPIESAPDFANLCQHLADYLVVYNYNAFKRQFTELAFRYGILVETITQSISAGVFRQYYGEKLSAISSYDEMVRASLNSRTSATIIGTMLSCDLLASALNSISKSWRANFGVSLRETRAAMALALSYMVENHSQVSSDLTNLGRILRNDRDDPIQLKKRIREILQGVGRSQKLYDKLQTDFQSLLNKEPFPGQCSVCSPYSK